MLWALVDNGPIIMHNPVFDCRLRALSCCAWLRVCIEENINEYNELGMPSLR